MNVKLTDKDRVVWEGTLEEFVKNNEGVLESGDEERLEDGASVVVGGGAHGAFELVKSGGR